MTKPSEIMSTSVEHKVKRPVFVSETRPVPKTFKVARVTLDQSEVEAACILYVRSQYDLKPWDVVKFSSEGVAWKSCDFDLEVVRDE